MDKNPVISFVSPVYKAEKILDKLVAEIAATMLEIGVSFEIILVDDRSPDTSWAVMQQISERYPQVKSIRLSRNLVSTRLLWRDWRKPKASGWWLWIAT
ncbi:Glycosyl transferase family 2 [Flavobacterium saliperosum]|uniref:Glycosyl transferase family 2 n=1 Tax=Flavobacterium saliperosum TaxID=329186 RepID=A0A1G4VPI7_9FLAO|nr:glycosyltransferase [Flavobacterium saliperosum]SCX09911.1 Glycosyl transferase family 2 [Flavobacterium saliperosum]